MREIKFRAWDDKNNVMYLCALPSRTSAVAAWLTKKEFDSSKFPSYFEDGRAILMQYTGLKDKNGKEVYENDLVKYISAQNNTYIGEVKWNPFENMAGFQTSNPCINIFKQFQIEVIGNIYEDKELLEGEK